jgi:ribosomal protein S6
MTQVEIDDLSPLEDFEKEARINPNVLRFIKLKLG